MFYLKCKIVRKCDFFQYLMTITLATFQRISVTKVTCTDNFTFYRAVHRCLHSKLADQQHGEQATRGHQAYQAVSVLDYPGERHEGATT